MRKVTERLLVACVAALAVGACQDSVTVVEPAPPPPPPPPPSVDATVTIQGLRSIPGNAPVNPTAVAGDINVVLNVEEGTNTVTGISLLLDGNELGCQGISTSEGPAGAPRLSGAVDEVECFFNSDDVVGECTGEQLDPAFDNGQHTLGARITLDDGTTRNASNAQEITLVNTSFIAVTHLMTEGENNGQGVIGANGHVFWGGPADLDGDGTDDNLVRFAACPTSYNQTAVGSVTLQGLTTNGAGNVDIGSGPGAADTDASSPFVWTADPADNAGIVEDFPGINNTGHIINVVGQVFDENGANVTTEFAGGLMALTPFFLDYTAPVVAAGAQVTVGGANVTGVGEYFSGGAFGVTNVTDAGVGFSFGTGAQLDVGDCSTAANFDDDPSTAFDEDFENVTSIDDLPEDDAIPGSDGFGNADQGGLDCYVGEVVALADDLANPTDLVALGDAINTGEPPAFHGVDRTEADLSNPEPDPATQPFVLNPDPNNDGIDDPGEWQLTFDGADPVLESGDPGVSINEGGCGALSGCANIVADVDAGPTGSPATLPVGNNGTQSTDKGGADDDFVVDLGNTIADLADGDYEVTVTVPDLAIPANDATLTYTFTLDNTPPSFGALNPVPGGSAGTTATSIIQSIGGTITDVHEIATATLSVFADGSDAVGTGGDGACTTGDYKLSVSGNEIDQNDVDITSGTNNIAFNESFEIFEPTSASATVTYCFIIVAEDNATDKTGAAAGNMSSLETQADVNWLP